MDGNQKRCRFSAEEHARIDALAREAGQGDRAAQTELIDRLTRLIAYLAWMQRLRGVPIEWDDLFQEASIAVLEAAGSFDPAKSRFVSWAVQKVTYRFVDYIREQQPAGARRRRSPGFGRRCHSFSELDHWLDQSTEDGESSGYDVEDPGSARDFDIVDALDEWAELLSRQKPQTRAILQMRAGEMTQAAIASRLGISESRVSQLLTRRFPQLAKNWQNQGKHTMDDHAREGTATVTLGTRQVPQQTARPCELDELADWIYRAQKEDLAQLEAAIRQAEGRLAGLLALRQVLQVRTEPQPVEAASASPRSNGAEKLKAKQEPVGLRRGRLEDAEEEPVKPRPGPFADADLERIVIEAVRAKPRKPGELAAALGISHTKIGCLVRNSPRLIKDTSGRVVLR